jgi:nucleoside-diphosphate-sugar epimerase
MRFLWDIPIMRVLIAGCGYFGLALGAELSQRGHEVFGLTRTGHRASDLEQAGVRALIADITQAKQLAELPSTYDWVINSVASSGGGPDMYRALYLEGTRNLLEWLKLNPPKKFVYTSSTSVYGQNDGSLVDESSATDPASDTSKILIDTERLLVGAVREMNFPAIILRVAGIYGPDRGYWFKQFLKGEAVMEGIGDRWLNMIHRDDLVALVISALENGRGGEIYNAVDDEPVTQRDFFGWLAAVLQQPLPPSTDKPPRRKRGAGNKRVSNKKLKLGLGYRFIYPTFREGCSPEIERIRAETKQG